MTHFPHFIRDDSGAVTVDWTVLAAAVVGLGVASVGAVRTGVGSLGGEVEVSLTGASVAPLGMLGGSGSGGGGWQFTPLANTYDEIFGPAPLGAIEYMTGWGMSETELHEAYAVYASEAQSWIDLGVWDVAGGWVDYMYVVQVILENQGSGLLPDSVSVESMHQIVAAMCDGWCT